MLSQKFLLWQKSNLFRSTDLLSTVIWSLNTKSLLLHISLVFEILLDFFVLPIWAVFVLTFDYLSFSFYSLVPNILDIFINNELFDFIKKKAPAPESPIYYFLWIFLAKKQSKPHTCSWLCYINSTTIGHRSLISLKRIKNMANLSKKW